MSLVSFEKEVMGLGRLRNAKKLNIIWKIYYPQIKQACIGIISLLQFECFKF